MLKKALIILSFLFFVSVILMPMAMPYCGTNGFHMGFMAANNFCGHGTDLAHISFMRGLIFIGMSASIFVLARVSFIRQVFSLIRKIRKSSLDKFNFLLKQLHLSRMKPFDKLLIAYSSGIIQPKTF